MVRVLSFQAPWVCQDTGRCCTSGWTIPIEAPQVERLWWALDAGRVTPLPTDADPFSTGPGAQTHLGLDGRRCVFHDRHPMGGCRIQRAIGHDALPLACRQFPRVSVRHPGGVSVTLSHYCPSVRALLRASGPAPTIRHGGPGFPSHGEYVGFDADPDLPPLLHGRCLLDWPSWWLLEAKAVALVGTEAWTGLARLGVIVERLRQWRPGQDRLVDAVHAACDRASLEDVGPWQATDRQLDAWTADVTGAVPDAWRDAARHAVVDRESGLTDDEAGRFLAAHTFANWAAYSGRGLRTWYRSIECAAALLRLTGSPGNVDLLLRHLAEPQALLTRFARAERTAVTRLP